MPCQKNFWKTSLSLILLLFSAQVFAQNQDNWSLKNEKDNVKVYYRRTSDIHEIKLVSSIKTSLSGLIHLLSEVHDYPKWGYKVAESKLVKKESETEMYYYSRLDFPWPFQDRDILMHTKLVQDPETRAITATSVAMQGMEPLKKDVVRITNAKTVWTIWPGKDGWAYIEYYIYSDPAGNMPDWLVNMAIDVGPRETIKSIRKMLKKPEYQAVKLAYIKD